MSQPRSPSLDLPLAPAAARPTEPTLLWLLAALLALLAPATTIFRRQSPWPLINAASIGVLAAYLGASLAPALGRVPRRFPLVLGLLAAPLVPGFHLLRSPALSSPGPVAWAVLLPASLILCLLPLALGKDLLCVLGGRQLGASARRALAVAALGLGVLALAHGLHEARRTPRVVETTVPIANLPADLDGLRVVQLSDLHVGQTVGEGFLRQVVERVNELDPDVVVVTGDLVDQAPRSTAPKLAPLRELRAPRGVFFVGGNHERGWGAAAWRRELARLGLILLDPGRHRLGREGAGLEIVGLADRPDPRLPPPRRCRPPCLAIAHQARANTEVRAARRHGATLLLAGHTHGGQLFPAHLLARRSFPHLAGLHRIDGVRVYISRGAGTWGPPLRIGAPSEITLIRLRRGGSRGAASGRHAPLSARGSRPP